MRRAEEVVETSMVKRSFGQEEGSSSRTAGSSDKRTRH